jgi:hypothetical protein
VTSLTERDDQAATAVADKRRRAREGISARTLVEMGNARARLTILRDFLAEAHPEMSADLEALNAVLTLLRDRGIPNWGPIALSFHRLRHWPAEDDQLTGFDFGDVGGPPAMEAEPEPVDDAEAIEDLRFLARHREFMRRGGRMSFSAAGWNPIHRAVSREPSDGTHDVLLSERKRLERQREAVAATKGPEVEADLAALDHRIAALGNVGVGPCEEAAIMAAEKSKAFGARRLQIAATLAKGLPLSEGTLATLVRFRENLEGQIEIAAQRSNDVRVLTHLLQTAVGGG